MKKIIKKHLPLKSSMKRKPSEGSQSLSKEILPKVTGLRKTTLIALCCISLLSFLSLKCKDVGV
jgi:hypothetical protein